MPTTVGHYHFTITEPNVLTVESILLLYQVVPGCDGIATTITAGGTPLMLIASVVELLLMHQVMRPTYVLPLYIRLR
ncbi:MAG: hypothetical protein IPF62_14450 [Bacteroidetes bacterium]|nr:hypothetical protein [Bacteroidota bacterium]